MKILYICQLDKEKSPGIYNKIKSKVIHLENYVKLDLLCVSTVDSLDEEGVRFYKMKNSYINTIGIIMDELASAYDIVLMRYPIVSKALLKIVEKYPRKIFFEHNTLELNELKFNITSLTLQDYLYLIIKDTKRLFKEFLLPYYYEKKYGPRVLSLALGGVCVSNSVKRHELSRNKKYNVLVQGNGVEVDEIPLIDSPLRYDNIELLFVSGSANKWHGVDRLIQGIKNYKGNKQITLHLVGRLHHSIINQLKKIPLPHTYLEHGVVDRQGIATISSTCNIGVASLGLHRLGMEEGSTLKVREYMAMGLPFLSGYTDIDIPKNYPYVLNYPADNTYIDLTRAEAFLDYLETNKFKRSAMRNLSIPLINQKDKMKSLVEYLKVLNENRFFDFDK